MSEETAPKLPATKDRALSARAGSPEGAVPSSLRGQIAELLTRVAGGDEAAFADLLSLMGPRVYALSTKMVLDAQIGREVTQDVFLEIWQKAHTFDGALGNPDTWVTTIAFRRATDRTRSEERAKRHEAQYLTSMYTRDYDQTSETALELVEHQGLRASLQHLSPAQAQTVSLAFYDGLTYDQVATQLGIPLATVKTRIRDALIRLRKTGYLSDTAPVLPGSSVAPLHEQRRRRAKK